MAEAPSPVQALFDAQINELLGSGAKGQEAAAGAVTGLYFIFLLITVYNVTRDRIWAHLYILLFTAVRTACFVVRADLQSHYSKDKLVAFEVLFAIGFVPLVSVLIYLWRKWRADPAATLEFGNGSQQGPAIGQALGLLARLDRLMNAAMTVGAILAVVGATDEYDANTQSDYNSGLTLRKVGYIIFLVIVVLLAFLVLIGPVLSHASRGAPKPCLLLALGLQAALVCLMIKQIFLVIVIFRNPNLLFNSNFFYPLEVLPELLVLCIICFPGYIRATYDYADSEQHKQVLPPNIEMGQPMEQPAYAYPAP